MGQTPRTQPVVALKRLVAPVAAMVGGVVSVAEIAMAETLRRSVLLGGVQPSELSHVARIPNHCPENDLSICDA